MIESMIEDKEGNLKRETAQLMPVRLNNKPNQMPSPQ